MLCVYHRGWLGDVKDDYYAIVSEICGDIELRVGDRVVGDLCCVCVVDWGDDKAIKQMEHVVWTMSFNISINPVSNDVFLLTRTEIPRVYA